MRLLLDDFDVGTSEIDEHLCGPLPSSLIDLAVQKALTTEHVGTVVGADTVLITDTEVIGKPANRAAAVMTLQGLSGRRCTVLTAVAVIDSSRAVHSEVVRTDVTIRVLETDEIQRYVDTGAADDKAGALEIQDRAAHFVNSVSGCRANLYGLPLCATSRLLAAAGVDVKVLDEQSCCNRNDLEEYLRGDQ